MNIPEIVQCLYLKECRIVKVYTTKSPITSEVFGLLSRSHFVSRTTKIHFHTPTVLLLLRLRACLQCREFISGRWWLLLLDISISLAFSQVLIEFIWACYPLFCTNRKYADCVMMPVDY